MPERKIERTCAKCGKMFECDGSCDHSLHTNSMILANECVCGKCWGAKIGEEGVCDLAFAPKVKVILV